eukprot:COSAG02_NODE_12773_length_1497_cov_1.159514_1_plen_21_part_10
MMANGMTHVKIDGIGGFSFAP